jgi:SM-20-related protein
VSAVRDGTFSDKPYPHFLGRGIIPDDKRAALRDSFPDIHKTGFLTVEDVALAPPFDRFIKELESEAFTEVLSEKFGLNLHAYPRLTTIRKLSAAHEGRIHTDGPSKVMTVLVYLNETWSPGPEGRLRVLYSGTEFEPFACEVPPDFGMVFGFLRSDNSWHGHKPFVGERRVVQIAWIKDAAELARKKKRNAMSQFFKTFLGRRERNQPPAM